jgi:hypothetical protein
MSTSLLLSRHSGLDPETMSTALAGSDATVFTDSGFRRNDEVRAVGAATDCFVAALLAMTGGEHVA